ncbi:MULTISPECIES: SulP family inorganic anion transporter [Pasteurellaceae]|uniref:SulP family inorganic anion transporter n=1 Tax=Pasteurella atlantica TaxID=2827233 RepID=A0AAW8CLQ1_9PAST|nr:SulP family inorganic anion transporter [Pasteurella atlantica]MDP8088955.1 SulP family inorganic anion transporter [Pasteurella atlantica]MDP8122261.1 SulP family inorganic anion transporter [Pasteurella atlantica]MDP8141800.1 SulP family inorganic anion transporter [Pasteurella atlantica]MDP8157685.1 SulP family inorganic anion transporter [Pasteurella atlantica]MDP8164006.1 SulP family inorganic anion transporter [Pasteurella atlantica]
MAALVVSFVALSLGASFGLLSGRGALSGMIAAGVIAFVTSLFGGTRIQCSGPTAPMSAVAIAVLVSAQQLSANQLEGMTVNQIFNFTVILSGFMLGFAALFRAGNLIKWIPNSVISGFMSGIAVLIWIGQIEQLFVIDGLWVFNKTALLNSLIALLTLAIILLFPKTKNKTFRRILAFFPATLMAIIISTLVVHLFNIPIETINIDSSVLSVSISEWVQAQVPTHMSFELLIFALPLAFQLALLCYLDTLMTALVMDKISGEDTQRNRDLAAQGLANAAAALLGGLPGAQATIRSVLILKEGATSRFAGILVGVFVIVEIFVFLDWISLIPKAVFIGVLFKVGYDVFDRTVAREIGKLLLGRKALLSKKDVPLIVLTVLVTLFVNLSVAAIGATILFYIIQKLTNNSLPDLNKLLVKHD